MSSASNEPPAAGKPDWAGQDPVEYFFQAVIENRVIVEPQRAHQDQAPWGYRIVVEPKRQPEPAKPVHLMGPGCRVMSIARQVCPGCGGKWEAGQEQRTYG